MRIDASEDSLPAANPRDAEDGLAHLPNPLDIRLSAGTNLDFDYLRANGQQLTQFYNLHKITSESSITDAFPRNQLWQLGGDPLAGLLHTRQVFG